MRYNLPFKAFSAVSTSILHPQEATEHHFAFHNPEPQKLTTATECLQKTARRKGSISSKDYSPARQRICCDTQQHHFPPAVLISLSEM